MPAQQCTLWQRYVCLFCLPLLLRSHTRCSASRSVCLPSVCVCCLVCASMHGSVNGSAVGAWATVSACCGTHLPGVPMRVCSHTHGIRLCATDAAALALKRQSCGPGSGCSCLHKATIGNVAQPLQAATAGCFPKAVKGVYVASRVVQDYPAKDDYGLFMEMLQTAVEQDKVLCPLFVLTLRYCEVL